MHIPVLRHGETYTSLDTAEVAEVGSGQARATVSLANPGLVRRDARRIRGARAALAAMTADERLDAIERAATIYETAALPMGDEQLDVEGYVAACAATTGLTQAMVRSNIGKISHVMRRIREVVGGLTRGLPLDVVDAGYGEHQGVPVAWVPQGDALAAVLPSNSPGVHSLWIPALAMRTPVVLKPGSGDPFTPMRIVQALIAGGIPAEAFGFYPGPHAVGDALVETHDRVIVFGGPALARKYEGQARVEVHGPGYAKILLGDDQVDRWEDHLDLLVESVARNGGRSCINASTIVVSRHADAIADALAQRLTAITPEPLEAPDAGLAAFTDPAIADRLDGAITNAIEGSGAVDVSAKHRTTPRRVDAHGLAFLQPTVIRCEPDHPLAKTEFGFPFVTVVQMPVEQAVDWLDYTLVLAAVTHDEALRQRCVAARHVDRLHLGAVPTNRIRWDQPHEGNLFEWLYRRRAIAV